MNTWKEAGNLSLSRVKVDPDLKDKFFVRRFGTLITAYKEQLKTLEYPPSTKRPYAQLDNMDLDGLSGKQQSFAKKALRMLAHTAFIWEKGDKLTKPETLVNYLAPLHQAYQDRKRLLATPDGWNVRYTIGCVLADANEIDKWTWWDGINEHPDPTNEAPRLDTEASIVRIQGESAGNRVLRLNKTEQIRKDGRDIIEKVAKTVMVDSVGYVKPGLPSPTVIHALDVLLKVSRSLVAAQPIAGLRQTCRSFWRRPRGTLHASRIQAWILMVILSQPPIACKNSYRRCLSSYHC